MVVLRESIRAETCGSLQISPEPADCVPGVETPGINTPDVGNAVREEGVTAGRKVAGGRPRGVGVGEVVWDKVHAVSTAASRATVDRKRAMSFIFIVLSSPTIISRSGGKQKSRLYRRLR